MDENESRRRRDLWAHFRFSVVGPLLAAPPGRGDLHAELVRLVKKSWRHPTRSEPLHLSFSTIERWDYAAHHAGRDPVGALGGRGRRGCGRQRSLSLGLRPALDRAYPG